MSTHWTLWSAWTDIFPEAVREYLEGPLGIAGLVLVGLIAVYLLARMAGGLWRLVAGHKPKPKVTYAERLVDLPPLPGNPGPRRLTVEGMPVRVRLIVVAPVGKEQPVDPHDLENLLDGVLVGLKGIVLEDRPRIRVWPPQLSKQGFAPTFHREIEKPEPEGRPSRWVLVAGPALAGRKPILLGLALWADSPNTLGRLTLDTTRWGEVLRIQTQTPQT
jgi:hypothetical protein